MDIYVRLSVISIFSGFQTWFIRCVDFTRIAVSSTESDDVTNEVTYRMFNRLKTFYIPLLIL